MEELSSQLEKLKTENTKLRSDREKLVRLVNKLQVEMIVHREKEDAYVAEVCAILGGQAGLGVRLTAIKTHWCELWTERHHEPCVFDHVRHSAELKKKVLAYGDDIVTTKISSFILSDDPALVKARHPWMWFIKTFDTWRGIPHEPLDPSAETRDRLQGLREGRSE